MDKITETQDPAADAFEKAATPQPEPELDAYGRDVSKWIDVGGKRKPHP